MSEPPPRLALPAPLRDLALRLRHLAVLLPLLVLTALALPPARAACAAAGPSGRLDLATLPDDDTLARLVWEHSPDLVESRTRIAGDRATVQRSEGMAPLPGDPAATGAVREALPAGVAPLAWKYCGGGFGGYAVYLFAEPAQRDAVCARPNFRAIEPFVATR